MIAISNDFKSAMKQPVKELQAYVTGDTSIKSEDDLISFKISCDSGLCKTAMRKLEAKYIGEHNLLGQWVHVGYGVKLSDGTFEYLDYGSFLVTEITTTKDTGVTNIVGYDKMINSMKNYIKLEAEYPINLLDYSKLLCEACGLKLGNKAFGKNLVKTWEVTGAESYSVENGLYKVDRGTTNTSGIRISLSGIVETGKKYVLSYKFKKTGGTLTTIGGHCHALATDKFLVDNIEVGTTYQNVHYMTDDIETHTVNVFFTAKDLSEITDFYLYIQPNRLKDEDIQYQVWDIILSEADYIQTYTPYNSMNEWQITQELWENIDGITYRDILVQIAQVTGSTCIISNDDKVYFKSLTDTGETLTYDNMFKLKLEPVYGEINSVVLSRTPQEDNIYMRDEESIQTNGLTEFKIENNQIIDKDRDNAMTPIYEALKGISYYPFETTTEGLGWYEIGDNVDIINDTGDVFNTSLFNLSITIDGAIKETLKTVGETKTQTQYQYATTIAKRVKNTEIIVDKQGQNIEQLVSDMYEEDGIVNENFTKVYQDINNIVNSVQNSGGNNLIKNSVMFAYDNDNNPNDWDISGDGTLSISSNAESLNTGALSGHAFTLLDKVASQKVFVSSNVYYTFTTRIKKNVTGSCYVKLYNSNEEHIIELSAGEEAFYKEYELKALLPKDNYYIVEFYGSADSGATFTDNMLALGEYKSQWTQANGEIMNTQVNVNLNGVLVKSSVYLGDYTIMSPLEFAGYSNINGTITKVFSLNKDTTLVKKLEAEDELKMVPIKIVPVTSGDPQGWAFVPST